MRDLDAFGVMLRGAREVAAIRPIDLALEMGWSGTAPVYRYERGGANAPVPEPETITRLAGILGLDYADRILLLGLAGHIPETEPLSPSEEARLLARAEPILHAESHPAFLFDYRWRILGVNDAVRDGLGIAPDGVAAWRRDGRTMLDLVHDAGMGLVSRLVDPATVATVQMLRFQLFHRLRRHEAWYRAYPDGHADPPDPAFAARWRDAEARIAAGLTREDLDAVMLAPVAVRLPDGRVTRLRASQRNLHGAYDMLGMLVMEPD